MFKPWPCVALGKMADRWSLLARRILLTRKYTMQIATAIAAVSPIPSKTYGTRSDCCVNNSGVGKGGAEDVIDDEDAIDVESGDTMECKDVIEAMTEVVADD